MAHPDTDTWVEDVRRELLQDILPFWRKCSIDHEHGGFVAELSNDLTRRIGASKGLILNARILWTFAAVSPVTGDPTDRDLARRAYDVLNDVFLDCEHGGYVWEVAADGRVVDGTKKTYGQAFCVYALSEYARCFDDDEALNRAIACQCLIEAHAHDPERGGYWEARARDWSAAGDQRLSDKDLDAPKSMNNHLHVLEAYSTLHRVAPGAQLADRLRALIGLFLDRIATADGRHLHHFFAADWTPLSDEYTFGHDIEASWLLCEAAEVLGDHELEASVRRLSLELARSSREEGLDVDGGLLYAGRSGAIVDDHKEWWPQAEAVVGFVNAYEIGGDPAYLAAAEKTWRFIEEQLVDRIHGEWFWRVDRAGRPDPSLPKVSFWKCPYHNARACLEILRRSATLRGLTP